MFRGLKYLLTYEADYSPYEDINPYGDKKAYTSQSGFYGSIIKLLYDFAQLRASNIYIYTYQNPIASRKHTYIILTPLNPTFI